MDRDFESIAPHRTLDAGGALSMTNLHANHSFTRKTTRF
jgi:hypothetical protein